MKTKYDDMHQALSKIIIPYDIVLSKTDFFEETLLIIGGITEKPKGCHCEMNRATFGENCNFDLTISPESASALVVNLNSKFPELQAVDLTDTAPQMINGHKARFIRINCQAIQKHLLPLIEEKLKSNPEMAKPYQNKYSFNEVASQLHQRLAKRGISIAKTDCVEETICYLVNQKSSKYRNPEIMSSINKFFDVPTIKTESSSFRANQQDSWSTDLFITTPIESAKKIVDYFNSILLNSAKMEAEQQPLADRKGLFTKITIDNIALMKPDFLDSVDAALTEYSLDELDRYRVQSSTLSRKTSETINTLYQLAVSLKYSNSEYQKAAEELTESISLFKAYFELNTVKSVPIKLVKDIHSKRRILKGLLTPEDALLEDFQNKLNKPLKKSIQTVTSTINNQFTPLENPFIKRQQSLNDVLSSYDDILSYGPGMRC